ncbi:MAG TPA: tRNA (adenosine(37)-N6)-threonylcarbamoyltransferase complex transferase subunit TsaD [Candidatus Didemnitutus sp.]|jgi:N6-L-threonylcarbamoyladenine synthase
MILALESSCDETAMALFDPARGIVGEWVHSQIALHETYGGVVPDLASREHLAHFGPLLQRVLTTVKSGEITRIAVTQGPGLAACLAMGVAAAKSLALAWRVPIVGVNHLRAHAFSPFIELHEHNPGEFDRAFEILLPHLGLLVSGGNTALYSIDRSRRLRLLASTMDDAAGEALDKGAKLLGLGYPGGPRVEILARDGDRMAFPFPKAVPRKATLEFSFSGLKTSLRYQLEKMTAAEVVSRKADLAASYQAAVFDALVRKTGHAVDLRSGPGGESWQSVGLSGGVANNRCLREQLGALGEERNLPVFCAVPRHTGDNAAMIAFAAWAEREAGALVDDGMALEIAPRLALGIP